MLFCTISTNFHTRDEFACIKNLASHASEATTSAIGPESVRTPQWFLAMINALILLHEMFSLKYYMWNVDEYCKLIFNSVRLRPRPPSSAPSHWLKSVAWPVGPDLKFRDIPDWYKSYLAAMNKIFIWARPCVNKDFVRDDVFSCVFRPFS